MTGFSPGLKGRDLSRERGRGSKELLFHGGANNSDCHHPTLLQGRAKGWGNLRTQLNRTYHLLTTMRHPALAKNARMEHPRSWWIPG
jgi:hypothetical protein